MILSLFISAALQRNATRLSGACDQTRADSIRNGSGLLVPRAHDMHLSQRSVHIARQLLSVRGARQVGTGVLLPCDDV